LNSIRPVCCLAHIWVAWSENGQRKMHPHFILSCCLHLW
jgi:hypothetical protein